MYSDMSNRMSDASLPKRKLASVRATSVLPTPVGPRKMNDPTGRSGLFSPARDRRMALERAEMALARLEEKQAAETAEFDKEEARLANRRRALESKQREAKVKAEAKRDQAERAYRKAMKEWAG